MKYYKTFGKRRFTEDEMKDIFRMYHTAFDSGMTWDAFILSMNTQCGMKEINTENFVSVIDYLKNNLHVDAVKFYREIHKCTLREAHDMVNKIIADMKMQKGGV